MIDVYQYPEGTAFLPYHLPAGKKGNVRITLDRKNTGEELTVVSQRNAFFMGLHPTKVRLTEPVNVHQLTEGNGTLWMSTMPQELEQHGRQLARAHGHVLVGGLGIGLAVAIMENNPRVTQITVVEKNRNIIKLVAPHLPKQKAIVVESDLFDYLREARRFNERFDFAYFDIYCPTGEHELVTTVIPLRRAAQDVIEQDEIECWNEEEMLGQVRVKLQTEVHPDIPHPLLTMDETRFTEMKQWHSATFPFLRWMREKKPRNPARKIENYIAALKDPARFDREWGKYDR